MQDAASEPIIVTACFDDATQSRLDALRERYFPPGRTAIDAHLTLFHAIPAHRSKRIFTAVESTCAEQAPFAVALPTLYSLGRGFAVRVESKTLKAIHQRLAAPVRDALTPQDAQIFAPHVTLANKITPAEAKAGLSDLRLTWSGMQATIEALALWRYMGPEWRLEARVAFAGAGR